MNVKIRVAERGVDGAKAPLSTVGPGIATGRAYEPPVLIRYGRLQELTRDGQTEGLDVLGGSLPES